MPIVPNTFKTHSGIRHFAKLSDTVSFDSAPMVVSMETAFRRCPRLYFVGVPDSSRTLFFVGVPDSPDSRSFRGCPGLFGLFFVGVPHSWVSRTLFVGVPDSPDSRSFRGCPGLFGLFFVGVPHSPHSHSSRTLSWVSRTLSCHRSLWWPGSKAAPYRLVRHRGRKRCGCTGLPWVYRIVVVEKDVGVPDCQIAIYRIAKKMWVYRIAILRIAVPVCRTGLPPPVRFAGLPPVCCRSQVFVREVA